VIRALIADDHAIVRRGLMEILKEEIPDIVFAEALSAQQALSLAKKQAWDIAILDISMPGTSGLDILADLKRIRPELPILYLSVHPEEQFAKRAMRMGAAGYLTKDTVSEELVMAVRKLLGGGRYLNLKFMEKLAMEASAGSRLSGHDELSMREFQVLRMMASGKGAKEIADELKLSVKTVSTYRSRILVKLGLKSTADAIRYAIQHELVD
jgi:two-component system, NarL family, invasion response regulator UvrY